MINPNKIKSDSPDFISTDFNLSDFIDTEEAAKILGLKKGTLEIWRHQGGKGPEFYKFERSVRYSRDGIKAYSEKCCRTSTGTM